MLRTNVGAQKLAFGSFTSNLYTALRNLAPAHNTGARCLDMLKPKREANQRIVVTAIGTRRSSVWWRKGSAL